MSRSFRNILFDNADVMDHGDRAMVWAIIFLEKEEEEVDEEVVEEEVGVDDMDDDVVLLSLLLDINCDLSLILAIL
eukprot:CAMPEP_0184861814 /NCGR_PEP_ID=MMETSP0580-20130426/6425_1 /TAXON_ID=1118495 /ORGANISM="Dactyliosolen fragilissimus" /LENGTH=75 /DNA_ID=CAMNT_0027359453 /DNA_START=128 /DNA_END=355 /DNA_ORIENTATION=-